MALSIEQLDRHIQNRAVKVELVSASWDTLMSELNARNLKTAWNSGMKATAKIISRGVESSLAAHHPNAVKYSKEMKTNLWVKGGGLTVFLGQGQLEMARSKSGKMINYSHLFILRWLSTGTAERHTKKNASRGKITASHFFAKGVEQSVDAALDSVGTNISKALERAYARAIAKKK